MNSLFRAQRRAEHFDSLLEGTRPDPLDPRTAELLEVVGALRSVPSPQARPEFVADLRERLMVAAETELVAAPSARERDDVARLTIQPTRTRGQRRVRLALGAVALVGATTSVAVASQSAIPGDPLYPVKRAIENTRTGISVGDDAKGETILGNATSRLDEVDQLANQDEPDAALVIETLDAFADQAEEAGGYLLDDYQAHGDPASIQQLNGFTHTSIATLSDLAAVIPAEAHDALTNAAQDVVALDARANQLCPDCGDPISELDPQLAAAAADVADDAEEVAGGQLPGTTPSAGSQPGTKGDQGRPSTSNPPATPITIPTEVPTTAPSDPTDTLGTVVPSGTATSGGTGGGHHGGKGGKDKPDLAPVTDTVDEVVTGVVDGVNDVLNGLTGGALGQ